MDYRSYKIKSKVYLIEGSVNPNRDTFLNRWPLFAVKVLEVNDIHEDGCQVLISDGTYCYFETYPKRYYTLLKSFDIHKFTLKHKRLGTFKID